MTEEEQIAAKKKIADIIELLAPTKQAISEYLTTDLNMIPERDKEAFEDGFYRGVNSSSAALYFKYQSTVSDTNPLLTELAQLTKFSKPKERKSTLKEIIEANKARVIQLQGWIDSINEWLSQVDPQLSDEQSV